MCSACSGGDNEYRESIEADARARRRAEAEPLKIVCAWHGKNFGVELVMAAGAEPASHGICEDCRFIEEHGIRVRADNIYPPVPIRDWDWLAVDDARYDGPGCAIGIGATREAAVKALVQELREEAA